MVRGLTYPVHGLNRKLSAPLTFLRKGIFVEGQSVKKLFTDNLIGYDE